MSNWVEKLMGVHKEEGEGDPNYGETYDVALEDSDGFPIVEPPQVYPEKEPLPVIHSVPGGYEVVSHNRWYGQATANASGIAIIDVPRQGPGVAWLVDRIGTWVNTGSYASLIVFEGDFNSGAVLDVSTTCPDIADESQPIWVQDIPLEFYATGMTSGAQVRVTVQYRLLRRILSDNAS